MRQFNVQLSVEKVFIAQKTSEDRVWKGKAAGKDAELVGYGKGTGEGEWMGYVNKSGERTCIMKMKKKKWITDRVLRQVEKY